MLERVTHYWPDSRRITTREQGLALASDCFDDRVRRLEPTKILDADAPLIIFGMVIQGVTIDD
jgi:hypothetical protein